jgi:GNAT superfamily N-acetyltransferase
VLSQRTLRVIANYWSADFGCPVESLLTRPVDILTHGGPLAGYNGIFAIFRDGMATISFPHAAADDLRGQLPDPPFTPAQFANAYDGPGFRIIGPASLSYADEVASPNHPVRLLTAHDHGALQRLRGSCGSTEWENGGSDATATVLSGAFDGEELLSVAGYEIWERTIAHISVITHPRHRRQGYGRSVVAEVARAALSERLIPQYRTLESNVPSMSIAGSLGFIHYATTVAV